MSDGSAGASPGRTLHAVLEAELENVLQYVYAARQDVLEARREPHLLEAAERTLLACIGTLQVLLGLLRVAPGEHHGWEVPHDRMSAAFCILRVDGTILFMNAASMRLAGRDHLALTGTAFEDREWTDRAQMRRHLDRAYATGRAQESFAVLHGEGHVVDLTFRTERVGVEGEDALLLMSHVRPDGDEEFPGA